MSDLLGLWHLLAGVIFHKVCVVSVTGTLP